MSKAPTMPAFMRHFAVAASMALGLGCLGCSAEEEGCRWGVEDALEEVGARVGDDAVGCGLTLVPMTLGEADRVHDCLGSAPEGVGASAALQSCIDCVGLTVLVVTENSENFMVRLWSAGFDEEPPHSVRVTRCGSFASRRGEIACNQPQVLYDCVDPGPDTD